MEKLSKVFGRRAERALAMRRSGQSEADIETDPVVGLSGSGKSTLPGLVNRPGEPTGGGRGGWSLT